VGDVLSERWSAIEKARLALERLALGDQSLRMAYARLGRMAAELLAVDRVTVWDLDRRSGDLVLAGGHDARGAEVATVHVEDLGGYADALATRRVLAIVDTLSDPLAVAMRDGYVRPLAITSLLDAPIYAAGEVVGVVCHEHRGPPRNWTDRDADLALAVAEVASSLRAEHDARRLEHELRGLESRLHDASRRASVLRATQAIAHDLKNVLAAMRASAHVLRARLGDPNVGRDVADGLEQLAASGARLTELLGTEDAETAPSVPIDVDDALAGRAEAYAALTGPDRRFALGLGARGAKVAISASGLDRVVGNLLVNAREATSEGDQVSLSTTLVPTDPAPGERTAVYVEVRDDGHGLDEATIERLFEPYYSTKGSGRGLGLSGVQRIVEAAGGWIDVESEPGSGAVFRVVLPIAD
jgi:signal transduction histidine kinase